MIYIEEVIFKEIPDTNNRYYATNTGLIYDKQNDKYISQNKSKRGWLKCHIWYKNKRITIGVHRLIAYAFLGYSDLTVNHKDGNKENNNILNLEYMTVQEQNWHRSKILKRGNRRKVLCLENQTIYETIQTACDALGLNRHNAHISQICEHKTSYHSTHGYHFEYVNS